MSEAVAGRLTSEHADEARKAAARRWLGLCAGGLLGTVWFLRLLALDAFHRVRGDAAEYYEIALQFPDLAGALSFAGGRSVGLPLFIFSLRRGYIRWHPSGDVASFLNFAAWTMFALHVACVLFFFETMRRTLLARTGCRLHWALGAVLLAYPGMVAHTTVLMTDTLAADLLMLGFGLYVLAHASRQRSWPLLALGSGLPLACACVCRPSYLPALLGALLLITLLEALAFVRERSASACALDRDASTRAPRAGSARACRFKRCAALLCALGCTALLLPATRPCAARFGQLCLADPTIVPRLVPALLAIGADSPRAYWSAHARQSQRRAGCGDCVALRDPVLSRTWARHCTIDPQRFGFGVPACMLRRPDLAALFLAKKTIGLFDSYQLQDYAADITPRWARLWSRPFGALAFAGLLATVVLLCRGLPRGELRSPETLVFVFALAQALLHSVGHIEARYSYASVPGALLALFTLLASLANRSSRVRSASAALLALAVLLFLGQTAAWDASDKVLQRIESAQR